MHAEGHRVFYVGSQVSGSKEFQGGVYPAWTTQLECQRTLGRNFRVSPRDITDIGQAAVQGVRLMHSLDKYRRSPPLGFAASVGHTCCVVPWELGEGPDALDWTLGYRSRDPPHVTLDEEPDVCTASAPDAAPPPRFDALKVVLDSGRLYVNGYRHSKSVVRRLTVGRLLCIATAGEADVELMREAGGWDADHVCHNTACVNIIDGHLRPRRRGCNRADNGHSCLPSRSEGTGYSGEGSGKEAGSTGRAAGASTLSSGGVTPTSSGRADRSVESTPSSSMPPPAARPPAVGRGLKRAAEEEEREEAEFGSQESSIAPPRNNTFS